MDIGDFDHSDFVRAANVIQLDTEFRLCSEKPKPISGPAVDSSDMADAKFECRLDLFFGQLLRKLFERGGLAGSKRWLDQRFEPLP